MNTVSYWAIFLPDFVGGRAFVEIWDNTGTNPARKSNKIYTLKQFTHSIYLKLKVRSHTM